MMIVTTGDGNITGYRVYNGIMPSTYKGVEGEEVEVEQQQKLTAVQVNKQAVKAGVAKAEVHGVIVKDASEKERRMKHLKAKKKADAAAVAVKAKGGQGAGKKKSTGKKGEWRKWIKPNANQRKQAMKKVSK